MTAAQDKLALRQNMRALLRTIPPHAKARAGGLVASHIAAWMPASVQTVAFFVNLVDEINTAPLDLLLQARHLTRALPVLEASHELCFTVLAPDIMATHDAVRNSQPRVDGRNIDIFFVPGLAFDKLGHRLGRGKGYYDRALSPLVESAHKPLFIGLAMDEQLVSHISCESHDVMMDFICTPALGMHQIA